ncbi:MAG: helix-turn-helix transcriptional regulator [Clostridia bacterium]|nr:helix-turn-helix transcriptional regulator [Clostridia bacterium]
MSKNVRPYLALSGFLFKKLFIGKFAMPPSVYIIQMKINCASDFLRSGQYSITQVAELCGYENVCYFSRQFKKYVGISPSVFVERYKSSK